MYTCAGKIYSESSSSTHFTHFPTFFYKDCAKAKPKIRAHCIRVRASFVSSMNTNGRGGNQLPRYQNLKSDESQPKFSLWQWKDSQWRGDRTLQSADYFSFVAITVHRRWNGNESREKYHFAVVASKMGWRKYNRNNNMILDKRMLSHQLESTQ